jgi:hypothetical protein
MLAGLSTTARNRSVRVAPCVALLCLIVLAVVNRHPNVAGPLRIPPAEAISAPSEGRVIANSGSQQAQLSVPPQLHELEAEVMHVVWERGEASVREVMEALNGTAAKERAYTTY